MIHIVFEDEHLIVVNKQSGLLSVPSPKKGKTNLTRRLRIHLAPKKEKAYPCHRLDKETSGIIVYAKDIPSQEKVIQQFRERKIEKKYIAFVQGQMNKRKGSLKGMVKAKGKPEKFAITLFKTIKSSRKYSILNISPKTGRTNQIRIQLAQIGHPIIGERKYAIAKLWPVKYNRLCLHAYFIKFCHPVSGKLLRIKIPLRKDMFDLANRLG